MEKKVVMLSDIKVYQTVAGSWRAYITIPEYRTIRYNSWAINKIRAIERIKELLIDDEIPFDFSSE
jgi:hypothetical protein